MGDSGHGVGTGIGDRGPDESVTGAGAGPLLCWSAPELGRGDVLAGRYQIEAVIGTGGSGRVLRAFDRVARAAVALKILRPEYATDPVWTERFSRELRVGRQIQHPNVCRVFDIGEADGHRFLSMELATRGTVRGQIGPEALNRPLTERIDDARAVVAGAAALHAAGIIHRDLKPENLLRMDDGRLVVSDFGLATDPGAGPATTIMVGTPRYMAPEVVMGDPATARADVWALGIVLHEILFGVRPDRSGGRRGYHRYTPPAVTCVRERRLAALCGRCADDEPLSRPATAAEVRREFEAAVLGRRPRRAFDRRQTVWGVVGLAALAVLGIARDRWTNRAVASSSQIASGISKSVLEPMGAPRDWGRDATRLAVFEGGVHCFSLDRTGRVARVIWGQPRRAEDIERGGARRPVVDLLPETYGSGCPQLSPDGRSLLFERTIDGAQQIFLSASPNGADSQSLLRGSSPRWFPNGQEFSLVLDSLHAATFSVPTREMTVVADGLDGQPAIDDQSVDPTGSRLAVLYSTESFGSLLVVHALPGLEVVGRSQVPPWARTLRFDSKGRVSFTVVGPSGLRELVSADAEVTALQRVAGVSGVDLADSLEGAGGRFVITRKRRFDLVRQDAGAGAGAVPLTTDGNSVSGALSSTGKLLIQRMLPDGREIIVLRDEGGKEARLTEGPTDITPAFLPDSQGWIHVDVKGDIVKCALATRRCVAIHADKLMPIAPTPDPSGRRVAYLTSLGASRVRVISLSDPSSHRDLGPAMACGPVWTASNRLWAVASVHPNERRWAEINADSGKRTGEVRSITFGDEQGECRFPYAPQDQAVPQVLRRLRETSELVRTEVSSTR